ncbi:DinB family protein [Cryobacterium algoricola]|uniref:DinB family protein n=1 Tax=Cryobacterium algoricola TaxID=1259183 RepID=A0ABY2IE83_9MICO|nr:DinB family protein [Cryobacterium algoricola]TFB86924.1 DinB family protein [Cryobacterium algoricola]
MSDASDAAAKTDLKRYLVSGREALIWKLDGLSEYDVRRPLVPTGTNLLGLVKHMAGVEAGYLGLVFGRPFPEPLPWTADGLEFNTDMWATPDQTRESLISLYRRVGAHSSETIEALSLDTIGRVPWWTGDRSAASLHEILVHLIAETHRHAGHADLVRELIDGEVGLRQGNDNLPPADRGWWDEYRERVEAAAREAAEG